MEDQFVIQQQVSKKEQLGMSFKELLFKYLRFLPFIVLSLALALLGAYLYLRYTEPTFQSAGALLVKEDNGTGGPASNDQFQQMFVMDNSINIKNEIEILRSRPLLKRVIEDLGLNYAYFAKGKIRESNNYTATPIRLETFSIRDSGRAFDLRVEVVNAQQFRVNEEDRLISFGQVFENSHGTFRINRDPVTSLNNAYRIAWTPTEEVATEMMKKLVVAPGAAAGIIQMSFEAANARLAADFLNQLMKEYQVATREDKNETNKRMLEFIDGRLEDVEEELDSVTRRLLIYQRENNLINAETQSSGFFTKIETTDEEINKERVQDYFAQMIGTYLQDEKNRYDLVPSSLTLIDPTLTTLVGAFNVAQLERKALIDGNVPSVSGIPAPY